MKIFKNLVYTCLICFELSAISLRESVVQTISTNPDIIASYFDKTQIKLSLQEQEGSYFPTVDFSSRIEKSDIDEDKKTGVQNQIDINGWNAKLKLNQILYDGGKTPNQIEQYRHRYNNIKHTSDEKTEDLVLQVVNNYTKLVSFQELISLSDYKIKNHQKYAKMAKEKEEISGEILEVYLVNSKVKALIDNYIEQEVKQQKAFSEYKKLTGREVSGNICRPVIDESLIPPSIEDALDIALQNNSKVLAQKELIKEQVSKAKVERSKFAPTVKLEASAMHDKDIDLQDNGDTDTYTVALTYDWNLYNGGKDSKTAQKEKIAILEEKKKLDSIRNDLTDELKGSYNTYFKIKKRIKNIKEYILDNKAIVEIYNRQLQDGSRTFLDVLNAESELFRTKVLLTDTEFLLFDEYYNILRGLDILSDSILTQASSKCEKYVFNEPILKFEKPKTKTYEELSNELGLD